MKKLISTAFAILLIGAAACAEQADGLAAGIVVPYLYVQLALANDSTDGVTDAVGSIATEAEKLGETGSVISATARALAAATDVETARAAFGPLSDALIEYGEEVGFGELKVAYCPMAQKSWVQAGGDILNPFFGSAMLNCGTFTR